MIRLLSWLMGIPKERLDGDDAYYSGKSEESNPHPPGTAAHDEWRRGFYGKVLLLLVAVSALPFGGCAGCQNAMKHLESDFSGLDRTITLYGADGTQIKSWDTQAKVEDQGGTCYFLDRDGKAVIISGTFVIEEK